MSSRTLRMVIVGAVAAAIVLAATGVLLWRARAPDQGAGMPTHEPSAPGSEAERPALAARETRGTGPITLAGGVYDAAGNPVAEATITAEFELGPGVHSLAPGARAGAISQGIPADAGATQAGDDRGPAQAAPAPVPHDLGVHDAGAPDGGTPGTAVSGVGTPGTATPDATGMPGMRDAGVGNAGPAATPGTAPAVVAVSGQDGTFELVGLVAGRYRLRVEAPGIFTSEVRFFDVPAPNGVRLVVARKVGVRGLVVDAAGQPAANVEVNLSGETHGGVHTTHTDQAGGFELAELQEGVFQVWAAREAEAAPALRVSRLGPGPFDDIRLVLGPAAIVTGRVVDRVSGQGVAAAVSLGAQSSDEPTRYARSGPDGNFRIQGVPLGRWSAEAHAPGYVATEAIEFAVGGEFMPVIEMTPGAVISGRVVNGNGVPVIGAVVSATGTDAEGRRQVFGEESQVQRFRRASGLPALGGQSGDARFVPRGELGVLIGPIPFPPPKGAAALRIAEALRDDEGNVGTWADLPMRTFALSMFVTDEHGRFRLAGLEAGTVRLLATHAAYADAWSKPVKPSLGQHIEEVTIVMVPGVVLTGTVKNQRGEIIVGATITADALSRRARPKNQAEGGDTDMDGTTRLQAVTGLDGRYRLGPVATDLAVHVGAVHHGDVERTIRLGELTDMLVERTEDFVLPVADATLAGRVLDGVDFPVRGAIVTVVGQLETRGHPVQASVRGRQGASDESGRFVIDWLPAGTYRLKVEHPDFPASEISGATGSALVLNLAFGGGIEGQVRDAHTSVPVSGARVVATGPGKARAETAAGEDGGIELVPLAAGTWSLHVSAPGYVAGKASVAVSAGRGPREITVRDVAITLSRGATVAGTVRDANGMRVRAARVSVGEVATTTDENGQFRLRDVPTGEIVIAAERQGARGSASVHLGPGEELVTLEIALGGVPGRE